MSKVRSKVVTTAISVFVACLLELAIVLAFPDQVLSPLAYLDYRSCLEVHPGMTESAVIAVMGEPRSRDTSSSGARLLQYGTQWSGTGPITIVMNKESDVVDHALCQGLG